MPNPLDTLRPEKLREQGTVVLQNRSSVALAVVLFPFGRAQPVELHLVLERGPADAQDFGCLSHILLDASQKNIRE